MTQDHSKTPESTPPSESSPETPPAVPTNVEPATVEAASEVVSEAVSEATSEVASVEESQVTDAILEAGTLEAAEADLVESDFAEEGVTESAPLSETASSETKETSATPLSDISTPSVARSTPAQPSSPSNQQPDQPTGKGQALLRLGGQIWGIVVALTPLVVKGLRSLWNISLKVLDWLWNTWKALLPKLKPRLPGSLNRAPDWLLTTIAFSLVLFILWLITTLLPGKAPSVATEPVPPKLVAPAPVIDPDKLARLQSQVTEVADPYAEGLIQAVQANLVKGRMIVQVADTWYGIDAANQDRVANEILKRSRRVDFTQLELLDTEGTLVARSPVVGSGIVIYERTRQEG